NHLAAEDILFTMVKNEFGDKLDDDHRGFLEELRKSNRRYLDLANTLLELFRADMYQLDYCRTEIDPALLLQAAVDLNKQAALLADIPLTLTAEPGKAMIDAIPAALQQAFHNIIQNSVEASQAGQAINIGMSVTGSNVVVGIEDHGPGMPEEQVAKLFA